MANPQSPEIPEKKEKKEKKEKREKKEKKHKDKRSPRTASDVSLTHTDSQLSMRSEKDVTTASSISVFSERADQALADEQAAHEKTKAALHELQQKFDQDRAAWDLERDTLKNQINELISQLAAARKEPAHSTPASDRPQRPSPPAPSSTPASPAPAAASASKPTPPPARAPPPRPQRAGGSSVQVDRSAKKLTELPEEIFHSPAEVSKVSLSLNQLGKFDSRLALFENLKTLDVSYNQLKAYPVDMCHFTGLTELNLTGNRIREIAPYVARLHVQKLLLMSNQLPAVPPAVCDIATLTFLDLSTNLLTELPAELSQLHSLRTLDVHRNRLTHLPAWLSALVSLEFCFASENALQQFAGPVAAITGLNTLDVSCNSLKSLPSDISHATSLTFLHAKFNKLSELPADLSNYYNLQDLNVSENQLTRLPADFVSYARLLRADLSHNRLTELPAEIGQLQSLVELILCSNEIATLPSSIGQLLALETLNVSHNRLTSLPAELSQLASLKRLYVAYNDIASVPSLAEMLGLEELFLSGNPKLHALPEGVFTLSQLNTLYASNIGLQQLPADIGTLSGLRILDLSHNSLQKVPAEIGALQVVSAINLSYNHIDCFPADIFYECYELRELNLSHNPALKEVPDEFARLVERECDVLLDGNPVSTLPGQERLVARPSTRFSVAVSETVGRRPTQEDEVLVCGAPYADSPTSDLYAVFDGHAGRAAASFSAQKFPSLLAAKLTKATEPVQAIREALGDLNEAFREWLKRSTLPVKQVGCTAAIVLVVNDKCYAANIGDSRAVLARGGRAVRLTNDHKPWDAEDEARVRSLGGYVCLVKDLPRVNGQLATSRSIGDFYMHPFVSAEPYIHCPVDLGNDDSFIIIGCDGVWDVLSDDEAVAIVSAAPSLELGAEKLRDLAYLRGSDDNISVCIVGLKKQA